MGLNFSQSLRFGNAVDKARARAREWEQNANEWEEYSNDLKRQIDKLSAQNIQLKKISDKYQDIEGFLATIEVNPSVEAVDVIHGLKAKTLKHKSIEQHWNISKIKEENLKLIAEAEYDYHVLADPSYRLSNAANALLKIAENADTDIQSDKIKAFVMKMIQTGKIRDDDHREKFIKERFEQLKDSVKYESPLDFVPIIDSIPISNLEETKEQDYDNWKVIEDNNDVLRFLINN